MIMTYKVIHHTRFSPYTTKIRGTEIYILNHLYKSKHDVDIVSRLDLESDERKFVSDMVFATSKGRSQVYFIPYDLDAKIEYYKHAIETANSPIIDINGVKRRLKVAKNELASLINKRSVKQPIGEFIKTGEENYMSFLESELKKYDRLVLAFHELDHEDLNTIKRIKQQFGKKIEVIGHLHCLSEYYTINDPKKETEKKLFEELLEKSYFDKMVAVSDEVKKDFVSKFPSLEKILKVIKVGVDDSLYNPSQKRYKEEVKKELFKKGTVNYVVSYSGRIADAKGKPLILNLLKRFELSNPNNVGFAFACPPDDRPTREFINQLHNYAPNLVKQGKIVFCYDVSKFTIGLNKTKEKELKEYYEKKMENMPIRFSIITKPVQSASDIYIHPSSSESLGISVIEALKTGIPVVVSKIKGIEQYTTEEQGYFVKISDNYIDWSLLYPSDKQRQKIPKIEISGIKSVSETTKVASDFYSKINTLIERMKSHEIFTSFKEGKRGASHGKFARKTSSTINEEGFNLETMTKQLDELYFL